MAVAAFVVLLLVSAVFSPTGGQAEGVSTPQTARADLGPARELVRAQKYDEAEKLLAELQQTHPDDGALLLLRGEVLIAAGRPAEAVPILQHAVEVDPDRQRLHFQLGTALSAQKDAAGAFAAFARELELNQDPQIRVLAHLNRSILFQNDRKWNEAAAELERVLEVEPGRKEVYGDLAGHYLDASAPEEAAGALERAATAGFQSARLQYRVGVALFNKKAYEKAAEAFRKSLELQPDMAQGELSLAKTLDRLGQEEEAKAHLERYLELRPDAPEGAEIRRRLAKGSKAQPPKPSKGSKD